MVKLSGPTIAVVIASVLWGTTGTVAFFLGDTMDPFTIGAVTLGGGGLVVAALAGRPALGLWRSRQARPWLLGGAVTVVVYPLAFYTGMDLAGVAVGNIVAIGLGPLVGAAWEWRVDRHAPSPSWWWAMLAGAAGIVSLSTSSHEATAADPESWGWGLAAGLLAGFCYGTYSYAMARIIHQGHAPLVTAGAVFGAASLPLIAVAVWGGSQLLVTGGDLVGLGYLIAGPMVLSYVLYTWAMRSLKSSAVLLISLVEPAVATVLAVSLVGERFDVQGGLGITLIVVAVILAGRRAPVTNKPETS